MCADRFERLRHDAVVGRDHEDRDVGDLGAAGAHRRERFVTRRVEEGDLPIVLLDRVRADALRDAARFARRRPSHCGCGRAATSCRGRRDRAPKRPAAARVIISGRSSSCSTTTSSPASLTTALKPNFRATVCAISAEMFWLIVAIVPILMSSLMMSFAGMIIEVESSWTVRRSGISIVSSTVGGIAGAASSEPRRLRCRSFSSSISFSRSFSRRIFAVRTAAATAAAAGAPPPEPELGAAGSRSSGAAGAAPGGRGVKGRPARRIARERRRCRRDAARRGTGTPGAAGFRERRGDSPGRARRAGPDAVRRPDGPGIPVCGPGSADAAMPSGGRLHDGPRLSDRGLARGNGPQARNRFVLSTGAAGGRGRGGIGVAAGSGRWRRGRRTRRRAGRTGGRPCGPPGAIGGPACRRCAARGRDEARCGAGRSCRGRRGRCRGLVGRARRRRRTPRSPDVGTARRIRGFGYGTTERRRRHRPALRCRSPTRRERRAVRRRRLGAGAAPHRTASAGSGSSGAGAAATAARAARPGDRLSRGRQPGDGVATAEPPRCGASPAPFRPPRRTPRTSPRSAPSTTLN